MSGRWQYEQLHDGEWHKVTMADFDRVEDAGEVTSTESGDLADFLLARFAEDAAAIDEYGDGWAQGDKIYAPGRNPDLNSPWGPSRLLAECEAKRRIVEGYRSASSTYTDARRDGRAAWPELGRFTIWIEVARALALPYADHPDYREEWRP